MSAPLRMLRRRELEKKTGLSATSIYMLEKQGRFPQHTMLTPRCAVWVESEVDSWLAERIAERSVGQLKPTRARA